MGTTKPAVRSQNPKGPTSRAAKWPARELQFAAVLVLFSFAGIWLDRHIGTSPWLLFVMVFLGAAGGFYLLYRKLMKGQRLGDRRADANRRDGDA